MTVEAWEVIQFVSTIVVVALALIMLAVATIAWWGPAVFGAAEGTFWFGLANRVLALRWWLKELLVDEFPAIGRAIRYDHTSRIDWHLGALSLVFLFGRVAVTRMLASITTALLRPLLVRRFRITITCDRVKLGGRLTGVALPRDDNGPEPVRFRIASPEEYYSRFREAEIQGRRLFQPLAEMPPAIVEITHGYRRRKILFARRTDQAEAVVARCNEAMLRTTRTLPHQNG
jgi:hypothetical protein